MSMRQAINNKCAECIYDPVAGPGSWRNQVKLCTATKCPLYNLRPFPKGERNPADSGDIPDYVEYKRQEMKDWNEAHNVADLDTLAGE